MKRKVLLIRLDKIGDLICTLCVDQVSFLKDAEVRWVISQGLSFITENTDPKRKFLELSKEPWPASLRRLRHFLREYQPDVTVSFQSPWWVNYALWAEKVPIRAGVKSQWHSFLFLNRGLRQRRSQSLQHEADYNLDLLLHALSADEKRPRENTPILKLQAPENNRLLEKLKLKPKDYIVVHPGMAGSALNWPVSNYIEVIEKASEFNKIVLTGTNSDESWLADIKTVFASSPQVLNLQSQLSGHELLTILGNAKAVVAPSTGVAHIAASLGVPVLGLYSPLRVQHPRRWAARGKNVKIFVPSLADGDPAGPQCMEQIQTAEILSYLKSL